MGDAGPDGGIVLSELGLAVSPDGTKVAANQSLDRWVLRESDTAGTVVWDARSGAVLERFDNKLTGALAWHPDGETLAIGGQTSISVTDPRGAVLWQLSGHGDSGTSTPRIRDLAYSPDGSRLASLGSDGTVMLWSAGAAQCSPEGVLRVRGLDAVSIAFSPDGTQLAVAGPDGQPELWDAETGERLAVLEDVDGESHSVAYAPDGALLISTNAPAALRVLEQDRTLQDVSIPLDAGLATLTAASDGTVAGVSDRNGGVLVWDRAADQHRDLPSLGAPISRLQWAPHKPVLYGASPNEGVVAWEGTAWRRFELP